MQANLLAPIGEGAAVVNGPVTSKCLPSLLPRDNFWEVGAYRRVSRGHEGRPQPVAIPCWHGGSRQPKPCWETSSVFS